MKKELLVIIDMVNGFVKEGALHDPKINKITPNIIDLVCDFKKRNQPIIACNDWHAEDDKEFKIYPPHCVAGTSECDLIEEIAKHRNSITVFKKDTNDALNSAEVQKFFETNLFDRVIVTGCCTDICIQQFALSLKKMFTASGKKTEIVVPRNCVFTFDAPNHSAKEFHADALKIMKNSGIVINGKIV